MEIRKTLKYRLCSKRRNRKLAPQIDIAGIIWYHSTALQHRYYRMCDGYISKSRMMKHIAKPGNWRKARRKLSLAHSHLANKRPDHHFKLANQLLDEYDVLCFEDLNIEAVKRLWSRDIIPLRGHSYRKLTVGLLPAPVRDFRHIVTDTDGHTAKRERTRRPFSLQWSIFSPAALLPVLHQPQLH
ncbi:MAG: hypothetical protein GX322_01970 [Firmicutes bacterium]|nr:hypothetical protein [Bacillota bacterium]